MPESHSTQHLEPLSLGVHGALERWFRLPTSEINIVGTTSLSALALLLLRSHGEGCPGPHVVVLPRAEDGRRLRRALEFFSPGQPVWELSSFDVGVYSNLYPNRRQIAERINWLHRAQEAKPGEIFIASTEALLQRTLPFDVLRQGTLRLKLGENLPENWADQLGALGYTQVPVVEDVGSFSIRGGIVDVFSPAHPLPFRLELFGNTIDSIRFFDPTTQRSENSAPLVTVIPAQEVLFTDERRQRAAQLFKASTEGRAVNKEDARSILHGLAHGQHFHGIEFLVSYFYPTPSLPLEHFSQPAVVWRPDPQEAHRQYDQFYAALKFDFDSADSVLMRPHFNEVFGHPEQLSFPDGSRIANLMRIQIHDHAPEDEPRDNIEFHTTELREFTSAAKALATHTEEFIQLLDGKLQEWRASGNRTFLSAATSSQCQRLRLLLERSSFRGEIVDENDARWMTWGDEQAADPHLVHIVPRRLSESLRLQGEGWVFLRDEDLYGKRPTQREAQKVQEVEVRADALAFSDLRINDLVVHKIHGVGVYEGLKVMPIQGVDAELIQLRYKDNDRLYLPVFRIGQINKFSGPAGTHPLDKLGGTSWEKTKTKVRNHLRDIAAELLDLYATRSQVHRPPFSPPDTDFANFESGFPYEETPDQLRAINDVVADMTRERPMDRLVCGDVGFGKTEVALRATFKAAEDRRQVAVIAPTTVLTFQHTETFKRRFKDWPLNIRSLNRFVSKKDIDQTLAGIKDGSVDIVIGTHRLLSRDVSFKNLGLLIIDEEQKFGVQHKERLRKLKANVDTLTMSATPIPRTLNMSLMGLRDLSIINTPPADRLPTRTFVCKFDQETIRKAVTSEVTRGGQVFFIHNRIESIYGLMDEMRSFLPDVRMGLAHGQMEEGALEKVMISFFNQEIDMLVCTTIIESGMDIPRANTMFIDNAQQLGLSQLYQLRGRVGRSKERAYCYLLIPANRMIEKDAQERLKVIQENTALGSGIRIAQYDLELRGAGDLLGEEQSGHINAVGYEMYLELLDEAIKRVKGEPAADDAIEPEINVRIPALIPDFYMPDIRSRLSYYKVLSEIATPEDMDRIEEDLRDQFGKPPEPVINLMGLMLVRRLCKDLSIRDLSGGKTGISLLFTERTPLPPDRALELASRANKKYLVSPDSRLHIRMNEIAWPRIYEELVYLLSLCKR